MRRCAEPRWLLLLSSCLAGAAVRADRPAAEQPARCLRQDRHDPGGARHPLSRHDAADGRRERRHARHLPHPRARAGRRRRRLRPALSQVGSGRPQPARRHQERRRASGSPPTASRSSGCATRSTCTPSTSTCRRASPRSTSSSSTSRRPPTTRAAPSRRPTWRASSGCRSRMYPAGYYVRQIPVQASVIVPAGWKVATALRPSGQTRQPHRLSGDQLRDPGRFAADRRRALSPDSAQPRRRARRHRRHAGRARRDARADRRAQAAGRAGGEDVRRAALRPLRFPADHLRQSRRHRARASPQLRRRRRPRLFHRLGEQAARPQPAAARIYATAGTASSAARADLWTPDYRTPMQDSLLWVYEGQTQFWGYVLGARSGMLSKQDTLDAIASTAATYSTGTPGRAWRPLVDTTNDPIIAGRAPQPWRSWQRSEDYYSEGQLIWIDVDRIIRQQSRRQALDRRFRARLLRHARPRLGRADLHVRRRRRDAERGPALRLARATCSARVYDVAPQPPLEGITRAATSSSTPTSRPSGSRAARRPARTTT